METTHAHESPETERNVIVQEQNAVLRTFKGPGNPYKQMTIHPVQALGQPAVEAGQRAVMSGPGMVERKGQAEILHHDHLHRITCPAQPPMESFQHFPITKADGCFHAQFTGTGKCTRNKGGQPPVSFGKFHTFAVFPA